jgi:hypothetical protein
MPNHIKPNIITYHLCQITLNWKLSCKLKKWHTFSLRLKQNHAKRNHIKPDLTVLEDCTKTGFREIGFEVVNWMNWLGVGSAGGLLRRWTEQWCDGWKEGHNSRTVCPLSYIYFNLYIVVIHFYVLKQRNHHKRHMITEITTLSHTTLNEWTKQGKVNRMLSDVTLLVTTEHCSRVYHLQLNPPLHPHSLAIIYTWLMCGNVL